MWIGIEYGEIDIVDFVKIGIGINVVNMYEVSKCGVVVVLIGGVKVVGFGLIYVDFVYDIVGYVVFDLIEKFYFGWVKCVV